MYSQQPRTFNKLNQAKLATFSLGSTRIQFSLLNKAKVLLNKKRKVSQLLRARMKAKICHNGLIQDSSLRLRITSFCLMGQKLSKI